LNLISFENFVKIRDNGTEVESFKESDIKKDERQVCK
jgi:hypothetical protein